MVTHMVLILVIWQNITNLKVIRLKIVWTMAFGFMAPRNLMNSGIIQFHPVMSMISILKIILQTTMLSILPSVQ